MNKYTLKFKSREFEFAFFQNDKQKEISILRVGALSNLIQSVVIFSFSLEKSNSSANDRIISIAFFSLACISYMLRYFLDHQSQIVNILFLFKSVFACLLIGIMQLMTKQISNITQIVSYQPLLGFLLAIEIFCSIQGTNFLYKVIICALNITLYVLLTIFLTPLPNYFNINI